MSTAAGPAEPPPESARERVRSRLVAAARPLLAERGPGRVSLREIATAAGVNYGLIHQYVGTKDDLLRLVFRTASEEWAEQFADAGSTRAAVSHLMRPKAAEYVRIVAHTLLEGRDPAGLLGESPALRELRGWLASDAAPTGPTGPTGPGADPRIQAAALTAMALGWGLFGPFVQHIAGLGEMTSDEATEHVYALVRRAVIEDDADG